MTFVAIIFLTGLCLLYTRIKETFTGSQQLKIGVLAIFKNEAMTIREWVDHYKWQGVNHILLLNNNSTDDFRDKLKGTESFVTIVDAPKLHNQEGYYNSIGVPFFKQKKIDILLLIDIDEYLFVKDGRSLKDYLRQEFSKPNHPSQIFVRWSMFGSSGHDQQPTSIRKSFVWKQRDLAHMGKCAVYVPDVKLLRVHQHDVTGTTIEKNDELQLNHYAIMSKEYFQNVKMTRGDVHSQNLESIRDWKYFQDYDHKEVKDTVLSDLVHQSGL